MKDLVEAFTIFLKYGDNRYPTHCEHDVLLVFPHNIDQITDEDKARLEELGFDFGEHESAGGEECFYSYRFGSC